MNNSYSWFWKFSNRPFPSSLVPLFQNESKCETFHMKMSSACSFILMQISHFHKNGFALRLALKQRQKGTRKWPIALAQRLVQFWELSKSLVPINHELNSRSCDFLYYFFVCSIINLLIVPLPYEVLALISIFCMTFTNKNKTLAANSRVVTAINLFPCLYVSSSLGQTALFVFMLKNANESSTKGSVKITVWFSLLPDSFAHWPI